MKQRRRKKSVAAAKRWKEEISVKTSSMENATVTRVDSLILTLTSRRRRHGDCLDLRHLMGRHHSHRSFTGCLLLRWAALSGRLSSLLLPARLPQPSPGPINPGSVRIFAVCLSIRRMPPPTAVWTAVRPVRNRPNNHHPATALWAGIVRRLATAAAGLRRAAAPARTLVPSLPLPSLFPTNS